MKLSVIILAGIVAGAYAVAPPSFARDATAAPTAARTATAAVPATAAKAATKKPAAKPTPAAAARRGKEETGSLPEASSFPAEAVGWELIEDAKTGVRLGVPEKLVPRLGASRSGTRWSSAQGQIQIETFRLPEAALPALFDEERKSSHRQVASSNLRPDGFFILGTQGLKNFVVRAEAQGSEVRGVTVLYDQATEGTMGGVALAVANAFVGFPNPNVLPPAGLRRRVEYGSAIVVSSDGALVTAARNVDRCEAITVPPFGHAERIAEDKTSGLALVRPTARATWCRRRSPRATSREAISHSSALPIRSHRTAMWRPPCRHASRSRQLSRRRSSASPAQPPPTRAAAWPAWWICGRPPSPA